MSARWTRALAEPPKDSRTRSAFSTLSGVTRAEGRAGLWMRRTAWAPAFSAMRRRSAWTAGAEAAISGMQPKVAARQAMVEAGAIRPPVPAGVARVPFTWGVGAGFQSLARKRAQ